MDLLIFCRFHRGQALPLDTLYGLKTMYTCNESFILEFSSSMAVHHYWSLCSQMIPLSSGKALVFTNVDAEIWSRRFDTVMKEDQEETAVKIRWRASKNAGRTFASPTATSQALAASRRRGNAPISTFHFNADVAILGEVGKEDGQVLALLMQHVINATGLNLKETDYQRAPVAGEYIHLATQNPTAEPGKLRVMLASAEEVRRVYNALDGQTLQVGNDRVGIKVSNDLVDGQRVPGNEQRSWM
jgi:hypothetical protein